MEELENKSKKLSVGKTFEYSIEIYDVWDTTSKRIRPFGANRIVEGNTSFLFNEQKGFKEPFPENSQEFQEFEINEIEEKIEQLEKQIREHSKSKSIVSIRDLQKQLRIYRGYRRSIELRGNGSFMIINPDGTPTFQFYRIGNIKLPIYKNVDRATLYIPSELKTKNVTKLLRENEEKNGQEQIIKFSTYALILLLILCVCFMFYMGYKMQQLPLDVAETLSIVAENFGKITDSIGNIEDIIINNDSVSFEPRQNTIN
jgi:hypothetical protein